MSLSHFVKTYFENPDANTIWSQRSGKTFLKTHKTMEKSRLEKDHYHPGQRETVFVIDLLEQGKQSCEIQSKQQTKDVGVDGLSRIQAFPGFPSTFQRSRLDIWDSGLDWTRQISPHFFHLWWRWRPSFCVRIYTDAHGEETHTERNASVTFFTQMLYSTVQQRFPPGVMSWRWRPAPAARSHASDSFCCSSQRQKPTEKTWQLWAACPNKQHRFPWKGSGATGIYKKRNRGGVCLMGTTDAFLCSSEFWLTLPLIQHKSAAELRKY